MSGVWEAVTTAEAERYGDQSTLIPTMWEAYKRRRASGRRPLTSYTKSQWEAFKAGAEAVLEAQKGWDTYPTVEAIWELRRDTGSIFHPVFDDGTDHPTINVECPSGRVHNPGARVTTDRRGECSDCGYDLVGGILSKENHDGEE